MIVGLQVKYYFYYTLSLRQQDPELLLQSQLGSFPVSQP